jgi:arylformamidase
MTNRQTDRAKRSLVAATMAGAGTAGVLIAATLFGPYSALAGGHPPAVRAYIELNHIVAEGMVTYPGISVSHFFNWAPRFANGAVIDEADMLGITGTNMDAPYHIDPNGAKIKDYPLKKLVNLPIVIATKPTSRLDFQISDFQGLDVRGKAVLLYTGQDQYFGTPQYGVNVPYLSADAAAWLVDHGVVLVGIDTPLIDNYADTSVGGGPALPVHNELLRNGVVISEDMTNIGALPRTGAYLTAVPPRVPMASFDVRSFATVYEDD